MPLEVQPYRQQREYGCLPACLRTARDFFGERTSDAEASELCDEVSPLVEPEGGCDWDSAVISLSANFNLNLLANETDTKDQAWEKLRQCVEVQELPVVVQLRWHGLSGGKHAVVVCGIYEDKAEFINPQTANIEDMSKFNFLARWNALKFDSFYFTD